MSLCKAWGFTTVTDCGVSDAQTLLLKAKIHLQIRQEGNKRRDTGSTLLVGGGAEEVRRHLQARVEMLKLMMLWVIITRMALLLMKCVDLHLQHAGFQ
jgi:hypothetical protein